MAINSFEWNNGTADKPVPLTDEMINKLISAKNRLGDNMKVSGHYKGYNNASLYKSQVWLLSQLFPDLNFEGSTIPDNLSGIAVSSLTCYEGNKITITSANTNIRYLQFKIIQYGDIQKDLDTTLSDGAIMNRIHIEKNESENMAYIVVDPPTENQSWAAQIQIKVCPIYDDIEDDSKCVIPDYVITCKAVKVDSLQIRLDSLTMSVHSYNKIYITPKSTIPNETPTKSLNGYFKFNMNPTGKAEYTDSQGGAIYSRFEQNDIEIYCELDLYNKGNKIISNTVIFSIKNPKFTTIRLNQSLSDPNEIVLSTSKTKTGIGAIAACDGNQQLITEAYENNMILNIRKNSHCYVGFFVEDPDTHKNVMKIRQLNDGDRTRYYDPNKTTENQDSSLDDIFGVAKNGVKGDVWMRLPEFYYYAENTIDGNNEYVDITFSDSKLTENYNKWDSNNLIGVYKAGIDYDGPNGAQTLHSYSSKDAPNNILTRVPVASKTKAEFDTLANNRNTSNDGNRFTLISYEAHVVMALLYYCYYGNTDCQSTVGGGSNSSGRNTGYTNLLGMNDTVNGVSDTPCTNFWGLEDWWGNLNEYIGNMSFDNTGGQNKIIITSNDGTRRAINIENPTSDILCISKFIFGRYADLIPKEYAPKVNNQIDYASNFCDKGKISASSVAFMRSHQSMVNNIPGPAGVGAIVDYTGTSSSNIGTRLMYNGEIEEVNSWD